MTKANFSTGKTGAGTSEQLLAIPPSPKRLGSGLNATAELVEARSAVNPTAKKPLPWSMASDPNAFKPKTAIVRGFLYAGEVAVLVAPPATGKSAIAARIALDVRNGSPFLGRRTTRGAVLFIAAERESETRSRIAAMRGDAEDVPVLGPAEAGRIDLRDKDVVASVLATIREIERQLQEPMRLIVIDTMARITPGAEENSAKEMGALADALALIAVETNSAVLVLHHPARGGSGVRGSSAIDGAVDSILTLADKKKTGTLTLKVQEANSGPAGATAQFSLVPMEIGVDEDGEPITVITVKCLTSAGQEPAPTLLPQKMDRRANVIVSQLEEAGGQLDRISLLARMRADNLLSSDAKSSSEQLRKALANLKAAGVIDYSSTLVWLLPPNGSQISQSPTPA